MSPRRLLPRARVRGLQRRRAGVPDGDTAPGADFTVGDPATVAPTLDFAPGQILWINIRNVAADGTPSCPANPSSCGILVDFASPNRY